MNKWYQGLNRSPLNPPSFVFGMCVALVISSTSPIVSTSMEKPPLFSILSTPSVFYHPINIKSLMDYTIFQISSSRMVAS